MEWTKKKFLILILPAVIFCIVSGFLIKKKIVNSAYFNVEKIVVKAHPASGKNALDIEPPQDLLGKNLFSIDLNMAGRKLSFKYPGLRNIEVSRSLPDTLVIDIESRLPVAKLRFNSGGREQKRLYFIDDEGVILDLDHEKEPEMLPEILGLKNKRMDLKIGGVIKGDDLEIALGILQEYGKMADFKHYPIEYINVSDLSAAFFEIRPGFTGVAEEARNENIPVAKGQCLEGRSGIVKIIIGKDEIKQRIKVLYSLLSKIKSNLKEIKYIDLRFEDPVAGSG